MKVFSWKGCAIGCGAVILLFIVFIGITSYWLVKKDDFKVETTVLEPDTEAYARIYLTAEDELMVSFMHTQVTKLNENSPGMDALPEFFRSWQNSSARKDINKMLPMEVELKGMYTVDEFGGTVGFSIYGGIAKVAWFFLKRNAKEDGQIYQAHNTSYIHIPDASFYLALSDNIFYAANTESAMQAMLDPADTEVVVHQEDSRFEGLNLQAPVYGFAGVPFGQTAPEGMMTGLIDGMSLNSWEFLNRCHRIGFDLTASDNETLMAHIVLDTEDKSPEIKAEIEQGLQAMSENSNLEWSFTVNERERGWIAEIKLKGFANASPMIINR